MSQLKQDEWPAENEPTTTEAQVSASRTERARGRAERPAGPEGSREHERSGTDELRNVTPDEQVD